MISRSAIRAARALRPLQGRHGLYFSGQYTTGFDSQESAVYSAIKVAESLAPASQTLRSLKARLGARTDSPASPTTSDRERPWRPPTRSSSARGREAGPNRVYREGMVARTSPHSVSVTVAHLLAFVATKGLKLFAVIDHRGEAASVGLELRETKVVIFGNPSAGTPVMEAAPLAALDLPLRVLVWPTRRADAGRVSRAWHVCRALRPDRRGRVAARRR